MAVYNRNSNNRGLCKIGDHFLSPEISSTGSYITNDPVSFPLCSAILCMSYPSSAHVHPQGCLMVQKGCWSSSLLDCFYALYLHVARWLVSSVCHDYSRKYTARAATILKVTIPWAEGKRALEVFPWRLNSPSWKRYIPGPWPELVAQLHPASSMSCEPAMCLRGKDLQIVVR